MDEYWLEPDWLEYYSKQNSTCTKGDLTKPYAIILQLVLGILAFCVLILKRFCENEETQRTWLIWTLDTSKQGINMLTMHILNIIISDFNIQKSSNDPCTYYLASFILDTTIGLIIIWGCLKTLEMLIVKFNILGGYKFGEYKTATLDQTTDEDTGRRMPFSIRIWLLQTSCYLMVTVFEKVCTVGILSIYGMESVFKAIAVLLTKWVDNKDVEVGLTLFIIPLLLNCFMFWVVDNILMKAVSRFRHDSLENEEDTDENNILDNTCDTQELLQEEEETA